MWSNKHAVKMTKQLKKVAIKFIKKVANYYVTSNLSPMLNVWHRLENSIYEVGDIIKTVDWIFKLMCHDDFSNIEVKDAFAGEGK